MITIFENEKFKINKVSFELIIQNYNLTQDL